MKVVYNENVRKLIELMIPDEILKLNPVIAGGSMIALYYMCQRYSDSITFEKDLLAKIDYYSKNKELGKIDLFMPKFGDIDLWFLENNDIWSEKSSGNFLISDLTGKSDVHHLNFNKYLISYPSQTSVWANTYVCKSIPIQFIKKPFQDIEALFDAFDLNNCCIAYFNGNVYMHDNFETLHLKKELSKGNGFEKKTFLSKLFTMSRCFKYHHRYQLEFTDEIINECTKLMIESLDILKIIDSTLRTQYIVNNPPKPKDNIGAITVSSTIFPLVSQPHSIAVGRILSTDNPYGQNECVEENKLRGILETFVKNFPFFIKMKNFDSTNALMFLNYTHPTIKKTLEIYLDK